MSEVLNAVVDFIGLIFIVVGCAAAAAIICGALATIVVFLAMMAKDHLKEKEAEKQ